MLACTFAVSKSLKCVLAVTVRLRGGTVENAGRVEVFHGETFCSHSLVSSLFALLNCASPTANFKDAHLGSYTLFVLKQNSLQDQPIAEWLLLKYILSMSMDRKGYINHLKVTKQQEQQQNDIHLILSKKHHRDHLTKEVERFWQL